VNEFWYKRDKGSNKGGTIKAYSFRPHKRTHTSRGRKRTLTNHKCVTDALKGEGGRAVNGGNVKNKVGTGRGGVCIVPISLTSREIVSPPETQMKFNVY